MCAWLMVVAACAGCGKDKLTLRQAEELGQVWLQDLSLFIPWDEEKKTGPEEDDGEGPEDSDSEAGAPGSIRDCFVDDGWDPQGFKNPTEAIEWLTGEPRKLGKVLSADQVEGGCEMSLELLGARPCTVQVRVVTEDEYPKCARLVMQQ